MSRQLRDFYPTPDSVIHAILSNEQVMLLSIKDGVWEPCDGDSRITEALIATAYDIYGLYSTDIALGQDFFDFKICLASTIITNPPFKYIRQFIDHAFAIGVKQMVLVCPERLWACKKGRKQFNRHRPSVWANLDWREDYLGKGGAPDRALAVAIWNKPHSRTCRYEIWSKP